MSDERHFRKFLRGLWRHSAIFIGYLVVSIVAMALATQLWLALWGPIPVDQIRVESKHSMFLLASELLIGTLLALLAGFISAATSTKTTVFSGMPMGLALTVAAVVGAFTPSEAAWWITGVHIAAPIPLVILGAALWQRRGSRADVGKPNQFPARNPVY